MAREHGSPRVCRDVGLPTILAKDPNAVRVLQWNLLAHGLRLDGFLVRDVLGGDVHADRAGFENMLRQVESAVTEADMKELKERLATPDAKANLAAVVDYERRWARVEEWLVAAAPDIITLQELDTFEGVHERLAQLGYECSGFHASAFVPAHTVLAETCSTAEYLLHLNLQQLAYAPNYPSTARKIALRSDPTADDDGVAIFWRAAAYTVERISFLPFRVQGNKQSAAVRATLRHRCDGTRLHVMCVHLSSGEGAADEMVRLQELRSVHPSADVSLLEWVEQSAAEAPTIFCLDANSQPTRKEEDTVWKTLRKLTGVRSVWDDHFTPHGVLKSAKVPVSTNKMRGPLSDQPRKIGQHACGVIDHVFFSTAYVRSRHAWPPLAYSTKAEARRDLLPSLGIPSDHTPVVVDLFRKHNARSRSHVVLICVSAALFVAIAAKLAQLRR
eukprot:CAMPEP_0119353770 /NCGR_PEP_ID=MMETSP1334-20130426/2870_1 /TAXON_ID=127549 /ORGANISM="Calcidiscus leptoporus, Strain RCC1130" /LENGTH=444 /DNA_ID=CAMNT_0007367139 /DNA_START=83 /DNA_END=1417 /DNA_ORIENTATION=+